MVPSSQNTHTHSLPKESLLKIQPKWMEVASSVYLFRKIFITIGLLLTCSTLALTLLFSGYPLHCKTAAIISGVVNGAGALCFFAFSIYLGNLKYEEPLSFKKFINNYGFKSFVGGSLTINTQISPDKTLRRLFLEDFEKLTTFSAFYMRYGTDDCLNLLKYKFVTSDQLSNLLLNELNTFSSFSEAYHTLNKIGFNSLYSYHPYIRDKLRALYLEELQLYSNFDQVFQAFEKCLGFWELFTYKIAEASDFSDWIHQMLKTESLSSIENKYGSKFLDKLIDPLTSSWS